MEIMGFVCERETETEKEVLRFFSIKMSDPFEVQCPLTFC
jgi:hypothetical protein